MIQAQLAADALARRYPEHEFVLVPLATHGDRHPTLRLTDSAREGVFVKELEQALLDERAELAVHSAKDLPTLPTPGLTLAAFLKRADARDVLIARAPSTLARLPSGSRVGTGSPRRAAQVAAIRPDLRAVEVRGNVDTRLRRLAEGAVDALILAAAGLERLGLLGEAHELLPFSVMLPAPGQGALAIQAAEGSQAAELAAGIDHADTSRAVRAERLLLRSLGGGCLSAVGAYASVAGDELVLEAVVLGDGGGQLLRARARGVHDAEVVRQITARLEGEGSARLLRPGPSGGPLGAAGARVDVLELYRAVPPPGLRQRLAQNLDRVDMVTFTSSSTVAHFAQAIDGPLPDVVAIACIGPITAQTARDLAMRVDIIAQEYTTRGLVEAIVRSRTPISA